MTDLDPLQRRALTALYWHRLMATDQIGRLLVPEMTLCTVRRKLLSLRRAGLVDRVIREHRPRTWYVTAAGAALVEAGQLVEARPYRIAGTSVVSVLQDHALDVVETGLAFVESARTHGHECGPLSWTPEVAHHFAKRGTGKTTNRNQVISDAVLHYVLEDNGQRSQRTFFVELDRATMPVARLARKLQSYVRYHDHIPANPTANGRPGWRQKYPRFPRVLVVLSGAAEHVLERRLVDLQAYVQAMEIGGDRIGALATTLQRLKRDGPTARIARSLFDDGDPVPVFARTRST